MPAVDLAAEDASRFRHGQRVPATAGAAGECAVFSQGEFLGIAIVADGIASPRRVLAERPGRLAEIIDFGL